MLRKISRVEAKAVRGETINVFLYDRVSGSAQEEDGSSLETQLEDNTAYALKHRYHIVDSLDEVHTGYELDQRKKLISLMKRCKDGEADAIIFRTYDRLSRNRAHFTVINYEAAKNGYELFCVKEQFDNDNIYQSITREFMAIIAEVERFKIEERTREGKIKRAQAGRLINGYKPRYGYDYAHTQLTSEKQLRNTHYEVNEEEAKIICRIDDLYLQGYSMQKIAEILTQEGIPTPTGKLIWGYSTICKILRCEEYMGVGYAYSTYTAISENGKRKSILKPVEERIALPTGVFPVIRSRETYDKILLRLESAHSTAITCHIPKDILLRHFLYCSICGRKMLPAIDHKGTYQYLVYKCICPTINRIDKHVVQIAANTIEQPVIEYVTSLLDDLTMIEGAVTRYIATHSSEESVESYTGAIEQLKANQKELSNDLDGVRGHGRQMILDKINELEGKIEALEACKEKVSGDGSRWQAMKREMEGTLSQVRMGDIDFKHGTVEERRRVLRMLSIHVIVYKRMPGKAQYEIKVSLPLTTLDGMISKVENMLTLPYLTGIDSYGRTLEPVA